MSAALARAADGALQDNLTIPQGTRWSRVWTATDSTGAPITLAGWTGRAQVRVNELDPTVLFEWATSPTGGQGAIVLAGATAAIQLTGLESPAWSWRRGVYDLYLFDPSGGPTKLVKGRVTVSPSVTH